MQISEKGIAFIREVEGARNKSYYDQAGLLTIGVGHLLTRSELSSGKIIIDGVSIKWRNGLTNKQVDSLLRQDLEEHEESVNKAINVDLTQNQFDALVSFSFNVGSYAFKSSTLAHRLNSGLYDDVPGQLKRWVHSGGLKSAGLINRRSKEIAFWNGDIGYG